MIIPTLLFALSLESTLINPLDRACIDELVRLKSPAPQGSSFVVREDGKLVPFQVENGQVWICTTFPPQSRKTYSISPGQPPSATPRVNVRRLMDTYELDNGIFAIRIPASGTNGPVAAIRLGDRWVGESFWSRPPEKLASMVVGDGTLFGKVRLRYDFAEGSWSEIDVTLGPGWQHALVEERHSMSRPDYYEIVLSKGWKPQEGLSLPFSSGFFPAGVAPAPNRQLKPGGQPFQPAELYINLLPRWNQHCKDGWFFAATDGIRAVGALVTRASRWFWPHDNALQAVVKPSGDYAGLRCPTWHGARLWFLTAGTHAEFAGNGKTNPWVSYVNRYALESLDKLNHELIIDWPGMGGKFLGFFPYSNGVNPTGPIRGMGRTAVGNAGKPGNFSTLTQAQMMLHPDCYGSYYLYWSPENPNFFSDFIKPPIAMISQLKAHPRFPELAALAQAKLQEDVDHSVTLPGGAGQECPGYQAYSSGLWGALARLCADHLGFDPVLWERVKASDAFLKRISQPDGAVRRMLPMGDTHPGKDGPNPVENAAEKSWATTELPGFGVIFQHKVGTPQETYLAFKSGPNRGHYHGDQLAFHYCANARPVAVDHHCSYKPRAGQEHMHNRLAFSTPSMPWANMDGYERLIAFKTSPVADIAIGQVESHRLREVTKLPPENWHAEQPQYILTQPLVYRRTIVFIKGGSHDYFVIRDQFTSGEELTATYGLHVRSRAVNRAGATFEFDNLTLHCIQPAAFEYERLDWQHDNGGSESTVGVRLSTKGKSGQFITILYPGRLPVVKSAVVGHVAIGDDEIEFGDDRVTVKRAGKEVIALQPTDINLDRPQGQIGLFVPDAGYPFGQIPDWLLRQRAGDTLENARRKAWPLQP